MMSEFLIVALSIVGIGLLIVVLPALLQFILAQITLRRWPAFAVKQWAMSGLWLKQLPDSCPYGPYACTDCKCWTCPEYSRLHKPRDEQTYI